MNSVPGPTRSRSTTSPLEALESFAKRGATGVISELRPTFWGPESTLFQAAREVVEHSDPSFAERYLGCLLKLDNIASGSPNHMSQWSLVRQLACLYSGLPFEPGKLLKFLAGRDPAPVLPAIPDETNYFASARDRLASKYSVQKDPSKWTAADWELVGYVQEAISGGTNHASGPTVREETSIFLANGRMGRVLRLVGERLPGPPGLVLPHRWKLGLTHLGPSQELVTVVQESFLAVIGPPGGTGERFQVRWWLELHPGDNRWHDAMGEANSIGAAAACLAAALLERGIPRRPEDGGPTRAAVNLLDPNVGVSATRKRSSDTSWKSIPVGRVEFLDKKIGAAADAKVHAFVCSRDTPSEESSSVNGVTLQPVATLEDAYEALLATNSRVCAHKLATVQRWNDARCNTLTQQEFIDASERNADRGSAG